MEYIIIILKIILTPLIIFGTVKFVKKVEKITEEIEKITEEIEKIKNERKRRVYISRGV